MNIEFTYWKSPWGEMKIGTYDEKLVLCDWRYRRMRSKNDATISKSLEADMVECHNSGIEKCITQLTEYGLKQRIDFDLAINPVGTEFQQSVWKELMLIGYGKSASYTDLTLNLTGDVKAVRAVASANGANNLAIIIPCHRVIGKNNDLVGYAGGLPIKKKLLRLENHAMFNQLELFD